MPVSPITVSHRLPLIAFAGVVAAVSLLAARQVSAQSVTEVTKATAIVADSTIDFSHGGRRYFEYFSPDGSSRGGDGSGKVEIGKWYVRKDGTVCFIHANLNQSGCVFVRPLESSIEFHRIDGVVEGPFGHLRGNPQGL
ncbi:MAG: hypothetical protein ACJ8IK_29290 [Burkholderiaceae bacterium]